MSAGPAMQMAPGAMPQVAQPALTRGGDTRQTLFNQDWLFAAGDPAGADAAAFDDSAWRKLDLPHDWSIEGPFDAHWASGTAYLPAGIAWYRKHFTLPDDDAGKLVSIEFINGHALGIRPYGYISFQYDLTPYLNATGENVLAVRVDHHDFADSRWYPGSGIFRNVYLIATNPFFVDHNGTFVTTLGATEEAADVSIATTVRGLKTSAPPPGDVESVLGIITTIRDSSGAAVATDSAKFDDGGVFYLTVYGQGEPASKRFEQTFHIARPALWSVDHPAMYTAVTEITLDGKTIDTYRTPFGIRTIKFDPNTGFWLNGQSMKLKGVCLHEDAGALGSAIPQQVWERRLRTLKEAGTNAIRCSHNPPAPEFLDLCDRLGFLVMDEAFDEWTGGKNKWITGWNNGTPGKDGYHAYFDQWADKDIQDMVRRDRNHPSIIMWSIGNEIDYQNDPYPPNSEELPPIAARLIKDIKAVDTTRYVTAACAFPETNLFKTLLDVEGYNYMELHYAEDHAAHPDRVIYGSENRSDLNAWLAVANNPYIAGQFLWTGIDYMGEAHQFPNRASAAGFLDLAGFPKPAFYYRKVLWSDTPMVKLEPGAGGTLVCYSNVETVAFFQKGIMVNQVAVPRSRDIPVPAKASNGAIMAVGLTNATALAQDTYALPGKAVGIKLQEYKTTFGPGDGPNVAQIELAICDAAGNVVPDAAPDVAVSIAGPGRLLGIESGDTNSLENYQSPQHKAYHGRLLIYVETHGPVLVTTSAAGFPDAKIGVGK
jgi:beta-galactosidase/beta-glucuronidase